MKLGDKVRLLRGSEQGFITRFLDNDLVEIEIEDGFKIPILKKEVVVVSQDEALHFGKGAQPVPTDTAQSNKKSNTQEGIYLAFVEINDKVYSVHIINNTDFELPFILVEEGPVIRGLASGKLSLYSSEKVMERLVSEFEAWPVLFVQMLFFKKGKFDAKEPLIKRLSFKANSFFRSKRFAPVISKNAFLFNINSDVKPIDPHLLKEQMYNTPVLDLKDSTSSHSKPVSEVDLHIEKLTKDAGKMSSSEILEIQLQAFEKYLDQAIAGSLEEVVFIHGTGNGVLKAAIQKKLSKMSEIKFYKDAQKEKFGYGATLVGLK